MKFTLITVIIIFLSSCGSKEAITKQIAELKVQIVDLENSEAIKSHDNAVLNLASEDSKLFALKKLLERSTGEINSINLKTQIEGAELRVNALLDRVELLRTNFDDVNNLIKIKENEIIELEKKLK